MLPGQQGDLGREGEPDVLSRCGAALQRAAFGNAFINVLAQGGLVVLYGQQIMRSVLHDQLSGGLILRVERVQGHGAPRQIQFAEEFTRHRDFIGLGVDQRTAQVKLAGHGDGREDGVARAVAGLFAIDRDQFIGRWLATNLGLDSQQDQVEPRGIQP